jgi:hypothetical protein
MTVPEPITSPVAVAQRYCLDVIEQAARVAELATDDAVLARLDALDPDLGRHLRVMTDAVFSLDGATNFLGGPPAPEPLGISWAASRTPGIY